MIDNSVGPHQDNSPYVVQTTSELFKDFAEFFLIDIHDGIGTQEAQKAQEVKSPLVPVVPLAFLLFTAAVAPHLLRRPAAGDR